MKLREIVDAMSDEEVLEFAKKVDLANPSKNPDQSEIKQIRVMLKFLAGDEEVQDYA